MRLTKLFAPSPHFCGGWMELIMEKPKDEKSTKRPSWMKVHKCKNCKREIMMLLCPHCKNISMDHTKNNLNP